MNKIQPPGQEFTIIIPVFIPATKVVKNFKNTTLFTQNRQNIDDVTSRHFENARVSSR